MTHAAATDVSTAMTPHPIEVSAVSPRLDRTPAEKLPPYFTKTQLNRNRRWTFTEIDAFLGEPDLEKRMGDTTAKLYDKVRVLEVESRREWLDVATRLPQVSLLSWSHECPPGYYRVKDLIGRGWYRADIRRFLGRPHRSIRYTRGGPVKLYEIKSVHEIESSESFIRRPAAIAPRLFLEGYTLSKIRELLSLTHSEVVTYTKDVRESVRQGKLKRNRSKRKQKKQRKNKNITYLQRKAIVYFRIAGRSWAEVARLVDLPLHIVQNFGRSRSFRELRENAVMCLDNWFASEESED